LDSNIVQQAKDFLQTKWDQDNYTYPSFSDLIRVSLRAYQQDQLALIKFKGDKNVPKKEFSIRMDENLAKFYYSLPRGQRVKFIERSLLTYLNKI
jgi:hypothetical protein